LFFLNISHHYQYGDDWAQYVKEGMNIATGKPFYQSNYIFNAANKDYAPPFYTVGFPLMLAPVIHFFGVDAMPLLYFNAILLSMLLFASYYFLKTKTSSLNALLLTIIFLYSSVILDLKAQIISDIPCALFIISYYAIRENRKQWTIRRILLLALLAAFAILIRTQAFILVIAEIIFLVRVLFGMKKNTTFKSDSKYYALLVASVFVILNIVNKLLFPAPKGGMTFFYDLYQYKFTHPSMLGFFAYNAAYSYKIISDVLYHEMNDKHLQFIFTIIGFITIPMALLGWFVYIKKHALDFVNVIFILSCGLMLLSPAPQGLRYFLPAIPILLLFVAKGIGALNQWTFKSKPAYIAVVCFAAFILLGYDDYERNTRPQGWLLQASDTQAFDYIKIHVEDTSVVMFSKPRLLTFFTNKKSANVSWQQNAIENKLQFRKLNARYLLFCKHLNLDVINDYLRLEPKPYSDSVIINKDYVLYTLKQ
jgi:hypothetical protein